ncbi:MAG: synthase epsilon subunit [Candidatus Doudnabacteria bacterium]|nr:synthase epsilon subunit [Candidatus Doudnabacteria bacterium]
MAKLKFQIVSPERTVLHDDVDSLTVPTQEGQITILPNHVPLISTLQAGELIVKNAGKTEYLAVSGGFIEVRPGNEIIILADTAEHSDEIDLERAEQAKAQAAEDMKSVKAKNSPEYANFSSVFQKNLVRTRVGVRKNARHTPVRLNEKE